MAFCLVHGAWHDEHCRPRLVGELEHRGHECVVPVPRQRAGYDPPPADGTGRSSWPRWIAHNLLGVEPIELPGRHFPMLERPATLADVLVAVSRESPATEGS